MVTFSAKVTGQIPVPTFLAVRQKFVAVMERLSAAAVIEARQASPITVLMMQMLEVGAVIAPRFPDAFILSSFFWWLSGVSRRFSDSRHAAPCFRFTTHTMEVIAVPTKTSGPTKKPRPSHSSAQSSSCRASNGGPRCCASKPNWTTSAAKWKNVTTCCLNQQQTGKKLAAGGIPLDADSNSQRVCVILCRATSHV